MFEKTEKFLDSLSMDELTDYLMGHGFKFAENKEYSLKINSKYSEGINEDSFKKCKYKNSGRDNYCDLSSAA